MKKKTWKRRIKDACIEAGTYQSCFDQVIDTLAGILENRDQAQKEYERLGSAPVVKHTNKGGATNVVKNPALVVIMECNTQALSYWRDLGLTPKGLKALNDNAMKNDKKQTFEDVLSGLGI